MRAVALTVMVVDIQGVSASFSIKKAGFRPAFFYAPNYVLRIIRVIFLSL